MTDVHTPAIRSYNMSRIKGKDTKPEMIVRKFLFSNGFRYRLHSKKLPGKPDIILSKYRTVIFIHGCFWHGHEGCPYFVMPKSRTEWWQNKISGNKQRDTLKYQLLINGGWKIVIVWECSLKKQRENTLNKLIATLTVTGSDNFIQLAINQ